MGSASANLSSHNQVSKREIKLSMYTFIFLIPKQQSPSPPGAWDLSCIKICRDDFVCTGRCVRNLSGL